MKSMLKKVLIMLAMISMAMVSSGIARAAQEVKFLFPEPTSSALTYPEGQMLGVYCGAFDFHMKELPVLRGRYAARWVGDLYKSPEDVLNAVAMGAGQFTYTTPYFIEQFDPEWRVLLTPGLVKDMSHFIRIMNTPEWKAKQEELAKNKGFRILKWPTTMGNFFVYTNKGPVEKVEDLKGVKIRYAGQQTFGNAFKKLGIIGVAMPYSEVVSSLQTNMIDGHIDNIFAYEYYDMPRTCKYVISHHFGPMPLALVVNSAWWDALPEKERKAMEYVVNVVDCQAYFDNNEAAVIEWWDNNPKGEVIRFTPEELAKWNKLLEEANADLLQSVDPKLLDAIRRTR